MRTMSAIVCHAPSTRRLFSSQSQHGTTSPCSSFPCSLARDLGNRHLEVTALPGRSTSGADRCARPIAALIASATAQFAIAPQRHRSTAAHAAVSSLERLSNTSPQAGATRDIGLARRADVGQT